MKQLKFLSSAAIVMLMLFSCNSGSDEKSTDTTKTDSTTIDTTAKMAPPVNTTITTPVNMVVVVHKVANFAKWQVAFDEHDSAQLASGLHKYVIGRGLMDTNMVLVAMKADDINKAKAFAKDPGLKKAMQKGGVTGTPEISFITTAWQDTAKISSDIRSRTTFAVKDWDAWQKAFEEGKQERMDNGITDRVISHDVDNNKKVVVVTAVLDTTKAFAYYKSDALKKRREATGVIGEPTRFLYRVVKKY